MVTFSVQLLGVGLPSLPQHPISFLGHCLGPLPTLFLEFRANNAECLATAPHLLTGPVCPSSGGTELLALSSKGRLITCSLDLNSEVPVPPKMTMANAGQKIKELLLDIGDASER